MILLRVFVFMFFDFIVLMVSNGENCKLVKCFVQVVVVQNVSVELIDFIQFDLFLFMLWVQVVGVGFDLVILYGQLYVILCWVICVLEYNGLILLLFINVIVWFLVIDDDF